MSKLDIDPFPGPSILRSPTRRILKDLNSLNTGEGVVIHPGDPSFCSGKCFPVLIGGKLKGAIVWPVVEGYPKIRWN